MVSNLKTIDRILQNRALSHFLFWASFVLIFTLFASLNSGGVIHHFINYLTLLPTQKNIITKDKISNFETKLPYQFKRIHRSFIVNTSQLSAFTARDVEIDDKEIPIGESYKKSVLAFLKR